MGRRLMMEMGWREVGRQQRRQRRDLARRAEEGFVVARCSHILHVLVLQGARLLLLFSQLCLPAAGLHLEQVPDVGAQVVAALVLLRAGLVVAPLPPAAGRAVKHGRIVPYLRLRLPLPTAAVGAPFFSIPKGRSSIKLPVKPFFL